MINFASNEYNINYRIFYIKSECLQYFHKYGIIQDSNYQ